MDEEKDIYEDAEKIIIKEQEKFDEERVKLFDRLYKDYKGYIDEEGNFDFEKMVADQKYDSFKGIEDASQYNILYSVIIEDFINNNSIVKPVNIRPSIQPQTEELFKRIEEKRDKLLEQIGDNNITRNMIIGNNLYISKLLPIREEIDVYLKALQQEIAMATNTELGSDSYKEALIRICSNIVSKKNEEYTKIEEDEIVSGIGAK